MKKSSSVSEFFALHTVQLQSLCIQAHSCAVGTLCRKSSYKYAPTVHEAVVKHWERCDSWGQVGELVSVVQRVTSLAGVSKKLDDAWCMRSREDGKSLMWVFSRVPVYTHQSDRNHGLLVLLSTIAWMVSSCTFEAVIGLGDRAATLPPFYNKYWHGWR